MAVGFAPNTLRPLRARRNFQVLFGGWTSPLFFMKASTSGVAGNALLYASTENTVDIATAKTTRYNGAGLLAQDVRDLSALNGYRALNSSVANFGDAVGVVQGACLVMTRTYTGSPTLNTLMETDANGYLVAQTDVAGGGLSGIAFALASGFYWGIVEAASDSDLNPTIEPAQAPSKSIPSNRNFIRVRIF